MNIVKRLSDNLVQYAFSETDIVSIKSSGLSFPGGRAMDVRPETHEIIASVDLPDWFTPSAFCYNDGMWTVVNEAIALEAAKATKTQNIKKQYAAISYEPVEIGGIMWNGGDSSASAIHGAITLAQAAGETDCTLWDIDNINHQGVSFEDALAIAAQIALAYRGVMFERNAKIEATGKAVTLAELEAV